MKLLTVPACLLLAMSFAPPSCLAAAPPPPRIYDPRFYEVRVRTAAGTTTRNVTVASWADVVNSWIAMRQHPTPKTLNRTIAAVAMKRYSQAVGPPWPGFEWRCVDVEDPYGFRYELAGWMLSDEIFGFLDPLDDRNYTAVYAVKRWPVTPPASVPGSLSLLSLLPAPNYTNWVCNGDYKQTF